MSRIKDFYHSAAWANCRREYARSRGYLCERCAKIGLIVPGVDVHHRKRLTPANVDDPSVSLAWDNLELLCEACHAKEHEHHKWRVDAEGRVQL